MKLTKVLGPICFKVSEIALTTEFGTSNNARAALWDLVKIMSSQKQQFSTCTEMVKVLALSHPGQIVLKMVNAQSMVKFFSSSN